MRFVDNSDGTISDLHTGLMWEKKVALGAGRDYGNLNAADNEHLIACPRPIRTVGVVGQVGGRLSDGWPGGRFANRPYDAVIDADSPGC